MSKFKEGNTGRPKGTKNKFSELKETFRKAFEKAGGLDRLVELCGDEKNFMMLGKWITSLLPKEYKVNEDRDKTITVLLDMPTANSKGRIENVVDVEAKSEDEENCPEKEGSFEEE